MKLAWPVRRTRVEIPRPTGYLAYFPTGRCNFRCPSCELPMLSQKRAELSLDEIEQVFGRSEVLRRLPVTIAGGEPFLRRDLIEILDLLTGLGHSVFVTTNGWFVQQIRRLHDLARPDLITICVSVDGDQATHDGIRRQGSFERTREALETARSAGCQVQVNTVVQPDNLESVEAVAGHFCDLGVHHLFLPLWSFPGMEERPLTSLRYDDTTIARAAAWVNSQPTDAKYVLSRGEFLVRDCHAGATSCYIAPEGDVYACISMKELAGDPVYKLGSLREYGFDFDALWTSDRAWEVRRQVKSCAGCYSGCEVSRELHHGLDATIGTDLLAAGVNVPEQARLDDPQAGLLLTGEWSWREAGFRWTGRRAGIRLRRPAGATAVAIRCRAFHPDLDREPLAVSVFLDGHPIGRFSIEARESGVWFDQRLDLPPAVTGTSNLVEIGIEVDRVWVPQATGASGDSRALGVMVESVSLAP